MRKIKVLFVALIASLFFTTTAFAYTSGLNPEANLRAEIVDLIDRPADSLLDGENLVANLRLMVNNENELIIIDTGTENEELDRYLKSKLNYKKVKSSEIQHLNFYFIKVEFKK